MANYICQPITPRVKSDLIGKVKVLASELHAGQIIIADSLSTAELGNYEVFNSTIPSSTNLNSNFFALVLNDGFEETQDGRRPNGQPNYYKYTYKTGDTAPILFLEKHLMINISLDSIDQSTRSLAIKGNYLVPVASSTLLNAVAAIPSGTSTGLLILGTHNTPLGGNYGAGFATTLICTPINEEIDSGNAIISYSFPNQIGETSINYTTGDIDIFIPSSLNKNGLVATFKASRDAIVKVGNTVQVSGQTPNNFTNAVTYTVTSQDGETAQYHVNVTYVYNLSLSVEDAVANVRDEDNNPIGDGAEIYENETITISGTSSFNALEILVNGQSVSSGSTHTVVGDTTISVRGYIVDDIEQDGSTLVINFVDGEVSKSSNILTIE